jgi:23S rRNA (pseudouridine1915-N3)-methyltransferase
MKIHVIAVGKNMPKWVNENFNEYSKRLPKDCQLNLIEITSIKRSSNSDLKKIQQEEGDEIIKKIPGKSFVAALDEQGLEWSTIQLSKELQKWQENWQNVCLLIGGPEGLSSRCLQIAHLKLALSRLTFPHPLVRVIIAEQIYRAWSILNKHPYHR